MKPFHKSHLSGLSSEPLAKLTADRDLRRFSGSVLTDFACLLLTGPAGVGKSHLASWVCRQLLNQRPDLRIGVKTESISDFADLAFFDLLVFDDLDLFVKNERDGDALSALVAECGNRKISLILICDDRLEEIQTCSKKLISTLSSCFEVDLSYPDSQEKLSMARAMANHFELTIPIDGGAIANIKSPRELEGFLIRTKIINDLNQSGSSV